MGRCVYAAGNLSGIGEAVGHMSCYTFWATRELSTRRETPFSPHPQAKNSDYSVKVTPRSTPIPPGPPLGRALVRPFPGLLLSLSLSVFLQWTLTRHRLLVPTPQLSGEALCVMAGTPRWHVAEAPRAHPTSPCRGGIKGGLCSRPSSRPTPELPERRVCQRDNAGWPCPPRQCQQRGPSGLGLKEPGEVPRRNKA